MVEPPKPKENFENIVPHIDISFWLQFMKVSTVPNICIVQARRLEAREP
jgi:hypothetical protein